MWGDLLCGTMHSDRVNRHGAGLLAGISSRKRMVPANGDKGGFRRLHHEGEGEGDIRWR